MRLMAICFTGSSYANVYNSHERRARLWTKDANLHLVDLVCQSPPLCVARGTPHLPTDASVLRGSVGKSSPPWIGSPTSRKGGKLLFEPCIPPTPHKTGESGRKPSAQTWANALGYAQDTNLLKVKCGDRTPACLRSV